MKGNHIGKGLKLWLLGPLRAELDGQPVALPSSRKARAVLGYLATKRGGASRDELCNLLFADTSDPRGSLRWSISRLRSALKDRSRQLIVSSGDRILLADSVATDITTLRQLLAERQTDAEALLAADAAVDGDFLDDLALDGYPEFAAWRLAERAACHELCARLLRRIVELLPLGRQRVDHARRLVNLNQGDENAWALLIAALMDAGNLSDARAMYRLAHQELAAAGSPLRGHLRAAMENHAAAVEDLPVAGSPLARPVIAVMRCESSDDMKPSLARLLTASLVSATTRNKLCRVVSTVAESADVHRNSRADLELRSFVSGVDGLLDLRVQLVERSTGASVFSWEVKLSESADEPLDTRVFRYFASHFEFDLILALMSIAREKAESDRTAQDRFLLALPYVYSAEGTQVTNALLEFEAVSAEHPDYGPALCAAGWVRSTHPDFNSDPAELSRTSSLIRKAVDLCPDDAFVLGWAAIVMTHTDLDVSTARDLVGRALGANPHSPAALIAAGWTAHYAGEHERSIEYMDTLAELDAADPMEFLCYTCRAMALYQLERYSEAERWARRAAGHNPTFVVVLRVLAATLVRLARLDEAREIVARMVDIDTSENLEFFRQRSPYVKPHERERLCSDLVAAGLPESPPGES